MSLAVAWLGGAAVVAPCVYAVRMELTPYPRLGRKVEFSPTNAAVAVVAGLLWPATAVAAVPAAALTGAYVVATRRYYRRRRAVRAELFTK